MSHRPRRSNPINSLDATHSTRFFTQVSAVRSLIEAAKPELTADTLIVIHQGKVKRKEKKRKQREGDPFENEQQSSLARWACSSTTLQTRPLALTRHPLNSPHPPHPTPPHPPKKKQILKDDDTLGGVGFGDTSFLVLMTKVKSRSGLVYFFFILAAPSSLARSLALFCLWRVCRPLFLRSLISSSCSSTPLQRIKKQPAAKKKEEPKPATEAAAGAAGASGEPSAAASATAAEPAAAAAAAAPAAAAEGGAPPAAGAAAPAAATADAYTNTASQLMTGDALEQSITMVRVGGKREREKMMKSFF